MVSVSECENALPTKEDFVAVKEVDLAEGSGGADEDAPDVQVQDAVPEGCVVRPQVQAAAPVGVQTLIEERQAVRTVEEPVRSNWHFSICSDPVQYKRRIHFWIITLI